MLLNTVTMDGSLVVKVKGELDLLTAETFRNLVERELNRGRAQNLILDMEHVSFIDSSGLGVILGRYRRIREQGGTMAIVGVKPHVKRILELAGIMGIIKIYEETDQALADVN
ncbi:MAG: anti-sigma F factor antagonist [Clostridia bacterium]|jgi:stage II sporulation protein AA (anti-sigma F factor antagonist)|nr:anti-sigma F factor antagonist [Clostridia bacterium]